MYENRNLFLFKDYVWFSLERWTCYEIIQSPKSFNASWSAVSGRVWTARLPIIEARTAGEVEGGESGIGGKYGFLGDMAHSRINDNQMYAKSQYSSA